MDDFFPEPGGGLATSLLRYLDVSLSELRTSFTREIAELLESSFDISDYIEILMSEIEEAVSCAVSEHKLPSRSPLKRKTLRQVYKEFTFSDVFSGDEREKLARGFTDDVEQIDSTRKTLSNELNELIQTFNNERAERTGNDVFMHDSLVKVKRAERELLEVNTIIQDSIIEQMGNRLQMLTDNRRSIRDSTVSFDWTDNGFSLRDLKAVVSNIRIIQFIQDIKDLEEAISPKILSIERILDNAIITTSSFSTESVMRDSSFEMELPSIQERLRAVRESRMSNYSPNHL